MIKFQPPDLGPDVRVYPASAADFASISMQRPEWLTGRIWALYYHGRPAAIMSVMPYDTGALVFYDIDKNMQAGKQTIWRASKKMVCSLSEFYQPLVTVQSPTYPNAAAFLRRLGFTATKTFMSGYQMYSHGRA